MRKVTFKKWIPAEYELSNNGNIKRIKEGTNRYSKDYLSCGFFHKWAVQYDEFENGQGNYTVAIIELPDGTIKEIEPNKIRFIE